MLDTIEKLLILQDRDRKIRRTRDELAHIEPARQSMKAKSAGADAELERLKTEARRIESQKKDFELEVETKKELISKYANQQFQTRKNEEYRALAHEIDNCKQGIFKSEDQQIALMEQAEVLQGRIVQATRMAADARKLVDENLAQLAKSEQNLRAELSGLEANREELASALDDSARGRYERLMRNKGDSVVVGINHGVCGGCHMRIPPQLLVTCQADKELVTCSNCGRILYFTHDMDLAMAD